MTKRIIMKSTYCKSFMSLTQMKDYTHEEIDDAKGYLRDFV